ncbi:MAG: NADP-dependent phosphogluconate dehydrogenase [Acidobacteria bacterium]|nr:NADP-dependent phosphogluconate dehydrogenase [Acidobacteriota bacterium]
MGRNLALNAASKGFSVAGYDADATKGRDLAEAAKGKQFSAAATLQEFVDSLEAPRRIWMMVPAGKIVDAVLGGLKPILTTDDIVIDGGNSYFKDTERRASDWESAGLRFFGMGVSGGEEGALHGPSLMPGGHEPSYRRLEEVLTRMAAQTSDGPCCTYLGPGGAGHYVKMVHNAIEYGIMQAICEAYDLLKNVVGLSAPEIRDHFAEWNAGDLNSFLLEISVTVLGKIDSETRMPLVDLVVDTAEQKGTGKWAAQDAFDIGVAVPTLVASVVARIISGAKDDRDAASKILTGPPGAFSGDKAQFIARLRDAYSLTVLACYAQGFEQMRVASSEYRYNLLPAEIARIWKGGCIIRARLLDPILGAFQENPELKNLMVAPHFSRLINEKAGSLREIVRTASEFGTPCPVFSSSLAYIDSYRQARLPANLLQAQRDYFGAHTYRRLDKEGKFHTDWEK